MDFDRQPVRIRVKLHGKIGFGLGLEHHARDAVAGLSHAYFLEKSVVNGDALIEQSGRHLRVVQVKIDSGGSVDRMGLVLHLVFEINHDRT